MFNFFGLDSVDKVFDHLTEKHKARKGWQMKMSDPNDDFGVLKMKADFVDALMVGQRDMTFKEASEFLSFNGVSVSPGDIANYFLEEGLLCSLDECGYDATDEGWDSECIRAEGLWEQPEVGVSKQLRRVFITVKGQQLLFHHFVKKED